MAIAEALLRGVSEVGAGPPASVGGSVAGDGADVRVAPPQRYPLAARLDLLPGEGVRWAARAMHYGFVARGGKADWRGYPVSGDKAPLNHAIGHLMEAVDIEPGHPRRVWKMAKAAANVLMAIWLEHSPEAVEWWMREKLPDAERKGAACT